jgi:DNA-binding response OmpR family regulator
VVILDLKLPKVDGLEVLKRVRDSRPPSVPLRRIDSDQQFV